MTLQRRYAVTGGWARRVLRIGMLILLGVWLAFSGLILLGMLILTFSPNQ
jgi:hypothetical protein